MQLFGVIVNVVAVIIAVLQLLPSYAKNKYFDFPYLEYDGEVERQVVIMANRRWKIMLIAVMIMWIANAVVSIYTVGQMSFMNFQRVITFNCTIMIAPVIIKDLFHNIIIYKDWFINLYRKHSPTPNTLNIVYGIDVVILFITIVTIFNADNEKYKVGAYFTLAIAFALSFCIYRVISEAEELLYSRAVKELSIKTTDGDTYNHIKMYVERKNTICIKIKNDEALYIPKDQIVYVKKVICKNHMMDDILDAVRNNK